MKVVIMSPIWKRLKLTNYVFRYYSKLKATLIPAIELILVAVGSEGDISKEIAEHNGYDYIECSNVPLNRKHNAGARHARKYDPDVFINMNSDTIISAEYFRAIDAEARMVMGLRDLWFLDIYKRQLGYWLGYDREHRRGVPVGTGRCFSREILKKCGWEPWKQEMSLNHNLDGNCRAKLTNLGIGFVSRRMSEIGCFAMDVKSDVNITSWSKLFKKYRSVLAEYRVTEKLEKIGVADIFDKVVQ